MQRERENHRRMDTLRGETKSGLQAVFRDSFA